MKCNTDYLPLQPLKDELSMGYIELDCIAISRVLSYVHGQCDQITNSVYSNKDDKKAKKYLNCLKLQNLNRNFLGYIVFAKKCISEEN